MFSNIKMMMLEAVFEFRISCGFVINLSEAVVDILWCKAYYYRFWTALSTFQKDIGLFWKELMQILKVLSFGWFYSWVLVCFLVENQYYEEILSLKIWIWCLIDVELAWLIVFIAKLY